MSGPRLQLAAVALVAQGCIVDIDVGSRTTFAGELPHEWDSFDSPVSEQIEGIGGATRDAIWAVGERGVILRFDGDSWTRQDSPAIEDLLAVYAIGAGDAWAAGDGGALLRYDGAAWSRISGVVPSASGGEPPRLLDVAGTGADDVWALPEGIIEQAGGEGPGALRFDGSGWSTVRRPDSGGLASGLTAGGPGEMWALAGARVQRLQEGAWIDVGAPSDDLQFSIEDALVDDSGGLIVIGYDADAKRSRSFRYDGAWLELEGDGIAKENLHLFAIAGDGEVIFAVGGGSHLARFDGTRWRTLIESSFTEPDLHALAVVEGRVFAAGADGALVLGD